MGRDCVCIKEVALALLLGLSIVCTSSGHDGSISSNSTRCHQEERDALLKFKDELNTNNNSDSWDVETRPDCCKWTGVTCHDLTGYVLALNLSVLRLEFSGKLSPALLELEHLRYLDLSNHDNYSKTQIPSFLGSMKKLRYLRLFGFSGEIPSQLGNLSMLEYLDASSTSAIDFKRLKGQSLDWFHGMPNLKYLNMNNADLSQAAHSWGHAVNKLSFLLELHLQGCSLSRFLPLLNLTSLRVLDLSSNYWSSKFPTWVANMSNLEFLDLSNNGLQGPIPRDLSKLSHLRSLSLKTNPITGNCSDIFVTGWTSIREIDFSYNGFYGEIPGSIGNLSSLVKLNLLSNNVKGVIPDSIGNLTSLLSLDLTRNHLSGKIPHTICKLRNLQELYMPGNLLEELPQCPKGSLQNLQYLILSSNNFHGTIPTWLGDLPSLSILSLAQNQLNDTVPATLMFSNLTRLDLGNNRLRGVLNETHFDQLNKLTYLDISSNQFDIDIRNHNWEPPFQLNVLYLKSCHIVGAQFPVWLQTQDRLVSLDLSNTSIKGPIPLWFWEWASASSSLSSLYLAHNQIEGQLPNSLPNSLGSINLSFNKLSGLIPPGFLANMMDISANNLSGPVPEYNSLLQVFLAHSNHLNGTIPTAFFQTAGLMFFDLSQNQITGKIPANLGNSSLLQRLLLNDNYLFGDIPESIGYLKELTSLHLKNNFLSGKLPMSLGSCSSLEILDIGENNLSGSISSIMTNTLMKVISLRKNLFSGEIPLTISRMSQLQVFDVSQNGFWGRIPPFQGMVKGGRSLVYSVDMDGKNYYNEELTLLVKMSDLEYGSILYLVTSIDLSNNHFEGEIPEGLMNHSELMFLNMSRNRLKGKIPLTIGDLQSLESLDMSNNQLTGEIPPSLSRLTSLAMLNFSDNRLQGRIPSGPQLDTFSGSSFANNLDLCGPQLEKQCPQDATIQLPIGQSNGSTITHMWFYLGILSGFVVGFFGVFGTLILRRDLRFAFFNFFDGIIDKFFMTVNVMRSWALVKNRGNTM